MTATRKGPTQRLKVALAFALAVLAAPATAAPLPSPPPIEHYTRLADIDEVVVSPSGKRLAVLVFSPTGRRRLAVMNLDPIGEARIAASFEDADISDVHWVNDERVAFSAFQRGAEIREHRGGTFAVNHDGTEQRQLVTWGRPQGATAATAIQSKVLPYGWTVHSTIDDGTSDVFVARHDEIGARDTPAVALGRLNTATGALRIITHGMPPGSRRWVLDAKREPRMVTAWNEGRTTVHWRAPGGDTWQQVADFDALQEPGFVPWRIDPDGQVYVVSRVHGLSALYKFDPVAKGIDPEPVVRVAGFDLAVAPIADSQTGRLVGLRLRPDRPMTHWFDDGLASVQRGVDAALPVGRTNQLFCGRCESTRFFVVRSSSDRQPGEYLLFDRSKASLSRIGAARPWLDEATQGRRSLHRVATRDGLQMPVYVTHPAGAAADAALPAVVLVHGGPYVRGSDLGWDAEAQFLASRGYRVIQPEFRGTTGYGDAHFKAGFKQWGRAMQDDLVDAVKWAARQGLIDPARVCIAGASYGGYAALMAPITDPGVFKCAASFAGVTDIDLMYGITWSDASDAARRYGMPVLIGDREKDAAQLAAASPLKRVAEIKVPVLLAHGAADRRVPIDHARKFASAAQSAGVAIERVDYTGEGHGFFDPANRADYFGRLERFLEASLRAPR